MRLLVEIATAISPTTRCACVHATHSATRRRRCGLRGLAGVHGAGTELHLVQRAWKPWFPRGGMRVREEAQAQRQSSTAAMRGLGKGPQTFPVPQATRVLPRYCVKARLTCFGKQLWPQVGSSVSPIATWVHVRSWAKDLAADVARISRLRGVPMAADPHHAGLQPHLAAS